MNEIRNILLVVLALLMPSVTGAQICKISGYVFDSTNDEPIPFAVVRLGDINQTTNFDGYFVFDSVPKGNYTLIASFLGYCDYEIKINTDALYNDLILKLSQRKYDDLKYFLAYRESVFFEPMTLERAIPNPNYKDLDSLMFPILELKNKSIEYALDTVLAYIEKHRNKSKNKYLSLRFEKDSNNDKLMDISLSLYHPEDDISKPDGVLKYKDRLIYVYGDFHDELSIDKKSDKEGDIYYENKTGVLDSIHFYFKQVKQGRDFVKISHEVKIKTKIDTISNCLGKKIIIEHPELCKINVQNYEEGFFTIINCWLDTATIVIHCGRMVNIPLVKYDIEDKIICSDSLLNDVRIIRGYSKTDIFGKQGCKKYFRENDYRKYSIHIVYENVDETRLSEFERFFYNIKILNTR